MTEAAKHDTVLDTGAEQLGKTYARALVGAAQSAGVTEQVVEQLERLANEYIGGSPKLAAAFASPRIDTEDKIRVIDRIFGKEFHPILVKFLKVMAGRDRLGYVRAVSDAALNIYDDMMGRVLAEVRTAVPLDDTIRSQVKKQLGSVFNKDVRLSEVVDPDLIGGMVVRVGDSVFDNSVANRLDKMARRTRDRFSSQLLQKFEKFTSE